MWSETDGLFPCVLERRFYDFVCGVNNDFLKLRINFLLSGEKLSSDDNVDEVTS
jgi:hypothetical protein